MKMNIGKFMLAIILGSTFIISCTKEKTPVVVPLTSQTAKDIQADTLNTGHYTFFNLKDGIVIPLSDSATTKWDIGFRGTTIIFNGGTSGPGAGGAFMYNGLFTDLTTIPNDSTFRQDNGTTLAIAAISGEGWYNYTGTTSTPNHAILPIPGKVIVIKTADGKYAKLEILSYYKGNPDTSTPEFADLATRPQSKLYTFNYVYQPDGSTELN